MANDEKLDKIIEDITEIKVTLARNTVSLEDHIRRTALLEEALKPVEKHVTVVNGLLKLILSLSGIAGLIELFKR